MSEPSPNGGGLTSPRGCDIGSATSSSQRPPRPHASSGCFAPEILNKLFFESSRIKRFFAIDTILNLRVKSISVVGHFRHFLVEIVNCVDQPAQKIPLHIEVAPKNTITDGSSTKNTITDGGM